jgi:hypothetical protein
VVEVELVAKVTERRAVASSALVSDPVTVSAPWTASQLAWAFGLASLTKMSWSLGENPLTMDATKPKGADGRLLGTVDHTGIGAAPGWNEFVEAVSETHLVVSHEVDDESQVLVVHTLPVELLTKSHVGSERH